MLGRSWVEIDIAACIRNYRILQGFLSPNQESMAVVKANAYGHGDCRIAAALQEVGVRNFAVSNIEEAIRLREAGIAGQILILGYTPVTEVERLLKYDITQAIISEAYGQLLPKEKIKVQAAIDTGMNRIGLDAENPEECARVIRDLNRRFQLTGIFTHLCVADDASEDAFTQKQVNMFQQVAELVSDLHLEYVHCVNSAAGLWHNTCGNLARLGIVLYGLRPAYENVLPEGIRPILQWKSVIAMVKDVYPGETIGYGRTYEVRNPMRLATVPTGYADGYDRRLSNRGVVLIHGHRAPVVGRVCMDQLMIDVTGIPDVNMGDEVLLLGEAYTADDMAADIGTIGYEIVCGISERVPRIYRYTPAS